MPGIGLLAAALFLTVLAHFGLPLPLTDPLRSTLVLLPLTASALVGIGMWANERGGRRTPTAIVTGEVFLLALLILLTLSRHQLGIGSEILIERCLIGSFVLLLMHRVAWLVTALRSTLGAELPRWPPAAFFVLAFIVYLAILPWSATQRPPDGDAPHYLLLTHSLAFDFDTDLTNNYEQGDSLAFMDRRLEAQPGDPVGRNGELYSRHNILLPVVLTPFYRLEGLFGALIVMAALTAITAWLSLALAHHYARTQPGPAVFAWAVLAFTVPFLLFSYQVWVEIPAALLVLVALIQLHQLRRGGNSVRRNWLFLGVSVALLPLLKIRFLLIAVPLVALGLWHGGRRARRGTVLLLVCLLFLTAGTLIFNQLIFQNPLKYHDIDGLQSYAQPVSKYLRGFAGLFFDCAFGLFANAPIWMLLLPALILAVRQRTQIAIDTCLVFLPYLLLLSPRGEWFGAWSPPYRYGVVMLPVLALWLIPLVSGRLRSGARSVIGTLAVMTLALTTLWIVIPGWTYNLAHGRSHVLDSLSIQTAADVARFFSSSIRLRTATYIWPLASLVLIGSLWWTGRRRSGSTAALLGTAAALLLPAVFIQAAEQRATRIVEFEDPWLAPQGGEVYPELWVVYRPQFRGGWLLPQGASIQAPIVAGGDQLNLQIDLQLQSAQLATALEIATGEGRVLAEKEITPASGWVTVFFEDLPWIEGDQLMVRMREPGPGSRGDQHAILDKAVLSWK